MGIVLVTVLSLADLIRKNILKDGQVCCSTQVMNTAGYESALYTILQLAVSSHTA